MPTPPPLSWHEAALAYAQRGWRVMPMHVFLPDERHCTCGEGYCCTPHPRLDLEKATTDPKRITEWSSQWEKAAIGLVLGGPAHLVALEVSPRENGGDTLSEIAPPPRRRSDTPTFVYAGNRRIFLYRYTAAEVATKISLGKGLRLYGEESTYFTLPTILITGRSRWARWLCAPEHHDVAPLPSYISKAADIPPEEIGIDDPIGTRRPRRAPVTPETDKDSCSLTHKREFHGGGGSEHPKDPTLAAVQSSGSNRASEAAPNQKDRRQPDEENPSQKSAHAHAEGAIRSSSTPDAHDLPDFQQFSEEGIFQRAQVQWYAWPWVAKNSLTVFTGRPKQSGKTTFLLYMLAGVLNNRHFLGHRCTVGRVAYVSDQSPDTLTQVLIDAGISNQQALDRLHVLYSDLVAHKSWAEVVADAAEYALLKNLDLLVFDSIQPFLGERPLRAQLSNPNNIAPLSRAVNRGLTVVVTCSVSHDADQLTFTLDELGTLANAADTIVHLATPEARMRRNRVIEIASQYPDVPGRVVIEHTGSALETRGSMFAFGEETRNNQRHLTEHARNDRSGQNRPAMQHASP